MKNLFFMILQEILSPERDRRADKKACRQRASKKGPRRFSKESQDPQIIADLRQRERESRVVFSTEKKCPK